MASPIGNIRKNVQNNQAAYLEGATAALGSLMLGASKTEAALTGVGQGILTKLVGPLGKFVGIATIATRSLYSLTKAWATMGTGAAARMETVQNQLRVMLKGLDAAKQRVRELRNFSIVTPFKMGDIVQGNRALESLTRGALTTTKAMTMVGDAAAQAGVGFEDMSVYVGRLYDGLAAGRPVGEVLFRLAELGVISGQARTAIEQLQESGSGFSEVWRVVEGELKRSSGTMGYTSKTLEGLQSTLEDTQDELKATFSENFLEGQKQAVEAQIQTLENLKPAVGGVGRAYGGFVSVLNTTGSELGRLVTSIPGVVTGMEAIGRAVGITLAGFMGLVTWVGGAKLIAGMAGFTAQAGRMAVVARGLGVALRFAVSPVGLLAVAVVGAVTAWTMYRDRVAQAEKAVREYEGASDAILAKLQGQAEAIKTLDSLQQNYVQTLGALAAAYDDWVRASVTGDEKMIAATKRRQDMLQKNVQGLKGIDLARLELPADVIANDLARSGQQREVTDQRLEMVRSLMRASEGAALIASLGGTVDELGRRRRTAVQMNAGVAEFQRAKAQSGINTQMVQSQITAKQAQIARANVAASGEFATYEDYEAAVAGIRKLHEELDVLKTKEAEALLAELKLARSFDNTIVQIQGGLSVYSRYQAAVQGLFDARVKLAEAEKAGEGQKAAQEALKEQEAEVNRLKKAYDELGWSAADAQKKQLELAQLKERMQRDMMNEPEQIAAEQRFAQAKRDEEEKQARLTAVRGGEIADRFRLLAGARRLRGPGSSARILEEMAAREADLSSSATRVNDLRGQGMGEDEARRMVDQQNERSRASRALDREGGLLQALLGRGQVVDSLQRIGGGGGQGRSPDVRQVLERLDKLIRAVEMNKPVDFRL